MELCAIGKGVLKRLDGVVQRGRCCWSRASGGLASSICSASIAVISPAGRHHEDLMVAVAASDRRADDRFVACQIVGFKSPPACRFAVMRSSPIEPGVVL